MAGSSITLLTLLGLVYSAHAYKSSMFVILTFILAFVVSSTVNAIWQAHVAETNPDITLGVNHVLMTFMYLINSQIYQPLTKYLGFYAYFAMCSVFAFFCVIYSIFVIKESKGLNDKERKQLYRPSKLKDFRDEGEDDPDVQVPQVSGTGVEDEIYQSKDSTYNKINTPSESTNPLYKS